jgi:hypothetical protein
MTLYFIPAPGLTIAANGTMEVRRTVDPGHDVIVINGRSLEAILEDMNNGSK